ncbi:MAG TPA: zinc-ribbon domain containing protein [Planctomycetota bacterium]|nr:zinc-ribbon domain containing protein [Planctomycetota bacterium]
MSGDKIFNCVECGLAFIFSEDEQKVHTRRGYGHEPRRCPPCRADARARRTAQEAARAKEPAGPGHVTLCATCGVEVFLPAPPGPGVAVHCDACKPAR